MPDVTSGVRTTAGQTQFTRMFISALRLIERARQSDDAVLRGRVHGILLEPEQPRQRRRRDDHAAAARLQLRDRLPRAFDHGVQVDLDRAAPVVLGAIREARLARRHAGVVVQDVEAAVRLVREREHRCEIGRLRDVDLHRRCLAARLLDQSRRFRARRPRSSRRRRSTRLRAPAAAPSRARCRIQRR